MNFEDEISTMLAPLTGVGHLSIERDQNRLIQVLNKNFTFTGSKVDWSKTLGHWCQTFRINDQSVSLDEKFESVEAILRRKNFSQILEGGGGIFYINDSSLDFGLEMSPMRFWDVLRIIVSNVPQHHYFFAATGYWCLAITMEGFVDFGYASKS